MENNQDSNKLTSRISDLTCDSLVAILRGIVRGLLWIAKNIWKRYFGIETPVYKMWWKAHSQSMQKKLDRAHKINVCPSLNVGQYGK